jgi:actin-related protein
VSRFWNFELTTALYFRFSTGRHTALVLDSGATYTVATPVYEGYPITSSVVKSPVGGNMIVDQCKRVLAEQNIDLVPYYKVASKVNCDLIINRLLCLGRSQGRRTAYLESKIQFAAVNKIL